MTTSSIQILITSSPRPFYSQTQKSSINHPFILVTIAPNTTNIQLPLQCASIDLSSIPNSEFFSKFKEHITKYTVPTDEYLFNKIKFKNVSKNNSSPFWFSTRSIISYKQLPEIEKSDNILNLLINTSVYQLFITYDASSNSPTLAYQSIVTMINNSKIPLYAAVLSPSDCLSHMHAMMYLRFKKVFPQPTDPESLNYPLFAKNDTHLKVLLLKEEPTRSLYIKNPIYSIPIILSPISNCSYSTSAHLDSKIIGGLERCKYPDYNLLVKPDFNSEGDECYVLDFEDRSCFAVLKSVIDPSYSFSLNKLKTKFSKDESSSSESESDESDDEELVLSTKKKIDVGDCEVMTLSDDCKLKSTVIIPSDVPLVPQPSSSLQFGPSTRITCDPDPNPIPKFTPTSSTSALSEPTPTPSPSNSLTDKLLDPKFLQMFSPYTHSSTDSYDDICQKIEKIKFIAPTIQSLVTSKQILSTINDDKSKDQMSELDELVGVCCRYVSMS